jgi:hypothetical protein
MGSTVAAWEFKCGNPECGMVHYVGFEYFDDKTDKCIIVGCIKDDSYGESRTKNDLHYIIGDYEKISSNIVKIHR